MITMKDIAREAGVSAMTVSRVINKRYDQVSSETVQRIEKIIQKYNYIPNSAARSLSSRSARIIAVFIKGDYRELQSDYNSTMLGYLIDGIQKQGYDAMVHLITRYEDVLDKLQSWQASGALFFGSPEKDIEKISENASIPMVFMDCYISGRKIINIGIEDEKGGALAAEYFLGHGHTNLAFSGENMTVSPVIMKRYYGFRNALRNAGITLSPDHILKTGDDEKLKTSLNKIRSSHLAIFCHSDLHAVHLMQLIREMGCSIPEDYSLIGFDDLPLCDQICPGLTTISQDICQKADTAVRVLMQHLSNPQETCENISLPVSMKERESVRNLSC